MRRHEPIVVASHALHALNLSPDHFSVGIDAVSLPRFRRHLARGGRRFLERVLLASEIEDCEGRLESLAARVAAKEATVKALGTGSCGVPWHCIEVERDSAGAPHLMLSGQARIRARALALKRFELSLSHDEDFAFALVVAGRSLRQDD